MNAKLPLNLFTVWLARGERGLSSEAIVEAVTGERIGWLRHSGGDHPLDAGDLNRCVKLLEAVPLAALVFKDEMRVVSPEWAALVDVWDELTDMLKGELSESWETPRTTARIREVLDGVRAGRAR